ncbi:hypothetical protein K503DRAFT_866249 [Rhizopogon vinicolor AM-OR11-026]|uniref:Uncharacterized protein n=1 Tax=Rhizopogon vinicolor AM-OR11-026 TaxID=1314800 RepID=A0A1B7N0A3_9AGAM|nr:hypothetical protein K503DRAFT_866249 [Rhizopogon vinicolor AM-OR11-026]
MLYLLNPKNLPFVGKGRLKLKKMMSLTRKEERDLMQEIATAPPGIYINESDSDDESTDSDCASTNSRTPGCDLNDCPFIDTTSDGKSLPSESFAAYMMILKGYTLLKRTFKALPRNQETMQSRKMQHHFSQAYKPTNASASFCTASTTPNKTHAPGHSVDHNPLSTIIARFNVTDRDSPIAVSPSSRFTENKTHVPDEDHDDDPRSRISPSSAPSGDAKVPSASGTTYPYNDEQCPDDVGEGIRIRKVSCIPQTPIGSASSEALGVLPNLTSFPHPPAVDFTRLSSLQMEHPGPSTEIVAFECIPFKSEERHIPLSLNLIPQLPFPTSQHVSFSAIDGTNFLANNITSRFSAHPFKSEERHIPLSLNLIPQLPFPTSQHVSFSAIDGTNFLANNITSRFSAHGAALNSHPVAFQNLPEQVPLAAQSAFISSVPFLSSTTYNGFPADLAAFTGSFFGPFSSESLAMSPNAMDTSFDANYAMCANENQPGWFKYSDRMDVEMAEAAVEQERALRSVDMHFVGEQPTMPVQGQYLAQPLAGLDASRSFINFALAEVPAAMGPQYANTYVPPMISAFGGISTGVPALGPSSDGSYAIAGPTQSTFDSTTHYGSAGGEPSAIQSVSVSGSPDILESHTSALSMPVPEQPAEQYPRTCPPELPPPEQHTYETSTLEREIQQPATNIHATLKNEDPTQSSSPAVPKVEVHKPAASEPLPIPHQVIHQETVVQPAGYDNNVTAPIRHMPQYIAPSAPRDDDTKTEPDDDTKTEPDDGINENDVNADILAHAILNIPLPPSVVASVQVLSQRKRRNSNCREGISGMRARRRKMNAEENQEDGSDSLRGQRTRLHHSSRLSPYGSVTRRRKGDTKGHERLGDDPFGGTHSEAGVQSSANFQTSRVESGNNAQSRSPFNPSNLNRDLSKLQGTGTGPSRLNQDSSTIPASSLRRLRGDADTSEERSQREGSKQTRFRGSAEVTRGSAQRLPHSSQPMPAQRPLFLRRATGFGSAGRGSHRPTNDGVHKRPDATAASRRARLASGTPAAKHDDLAEARRKFRAQQAQGKFTCVTFSLPDF